MLSSNARGAVVQLGDGLWDRFGQSEGRGDGHHEGGDTGEEGLKLHDGPGCLVLGCNWCRCFGLE